MEETRGRTLHGTTGINLHLRSILLPAGRHANSLSYCTPRRISRGTINFLSEPADSRSISCALIVLVPRLGSDLNSRMNRCVVEMDLSLFFFFFLRLSRERLKDVEERFCSDIDRKKKKLNPEPSVKRKLIILIICFYNLEIYHFMNLKTQNCGGIIIFTH